ncbi:hypothetical protein ACNKHR_23535 [Shigella flexneri]
MVIYAVFVYKLATGLPAIPEISLSWKALLFRTYVGVYGADCGAGRCHYREIPGVNRIKFSSDDIQRKFGPFGEPVTVGFVMGLIIGILAGYDVKGVLQLAVKRRR